jgi:putative oxidoreductase
VRDLCQAGKEVRTMSDVVRLRTEWEPRVLSVVRIMVGLLFMEHGLGKLLGFPPVPQQPAMFQLLWFAGAMECVGGLLVVLGLFTRVTAFVLSGEMAVAYFMAHAPRNFYPVLNGGDAAILYCLIFFYFFVAGAGVWSLDRLRSSEAASRYATG